MYYFNGHDKVYGWPQNSTLKLLVIYSHMYCDIKNASVNTRTLWILVTLDCWFIRFVEFEESEHKLSENEYFNFDVTAEPNHINRKSV